MQNRFYTPHHERECSSDVVIRMLKLFHLDVYDLLDFDSTLYFVTPYVAIRFDVLQDVLIDDFSASKPISEFIVAMRVYRNCLISLYRRFAHVDLVYFSMLDLNVILGIDYLHSCYASINCSTLVAIINFLRSLS